MSKKLFLYLLMMATSYPTLSWNGHSHAAEFEVEHESVFGSWRSVLYRNLNGNRYFCAIESWKGETVLRIAHYKLSKETFLEVHNKNWTLMEGQAQFYVSFNVDNEPLTAELKGRSWADGYTHNFTDSQMFSAVMGMLMLAKDMTVTNINGAPMASFSGNGSNRAAQAFGQCMQT